MSEFANLTGQRLRELWSGEGDAATAVEIKELAERADNQRRRAGDKTLRDEFAMAALSGILANPEDKSGLDIAKMAYRIADTLLEARR